MTRSRSLLASILGGFVSSDLRRAGPSSRLDNDPAPRLLLILTWQAPPLRHTTPVFSRRACLFLLSCTPSPLPPPFVPPFPTISVFGAFLERIATTHRHPRPRRGGARENCARRTAQFLFQQPHNGQIWDHGGPPADSLHDDSHERCFHFARKLSFPFTVSNCR